MIPFISACADCLTGYEGVHSDACPQFVATATPAPRAYRTCEYCQLTRTQTNSTKTPMAIGGPKRSNGLPAYQMKPVDGPCPRCGNDKPDGSFANPWDRISSITTVHGEQGNPSQRLLWVGAQAKRKAVAA